jgi:hypothetical protein
VHPYRVADTSEISANIVVVEPHYEISRGLEGTGAFGVPAPFKVCGMRLSVDLDDQLGGDAGEVRDVSGYGVLASEFVPVEASAAQGVPKRRF